MTLRRKGKLKKTGIGERIFSMTFQPERVYFSAGIITPVKEASRKERKNAQYLERGYFFWLGQHPD
jgi:hypothetical protein